MIQATIPVHLDTDLGGDIDDLAALALLRWPGAALVGVTTVAEENGRRAGYTRYALDLADRGDIPVAAGADVAGGHYRTPLDYYPDADFWPEPVPPAPGPPEAALDLLAASIAQGAIVVAIGPCTNLALLDRRHPGILRRARLCLLGGYVAPPRPGRSPWGNELDFNFQVDVASARHVLTHGRPTIVPLHVSTETSLRRAHLPALDAAGPLGALLARQARAFERVWEHAGTCQAQCPDLPPDCINHRYDPLACAVALGWPGAIIEEVPLRITVADGWLHQRIAPGGTPTRVAMRVDGEAFDALWVERVAGRG